MSEAEEKCHFCREVPFKYTCPKCNALYCSVGCYKSKEHLKCSEEFYKSCIQDELAGAATTPDKQEDMRKIYDILKRMRETDDGFNPQDFDTDGVENPLDSDEGEDPEQGDAEDEGEEDGLAGEETLEGEMEEDIATRLKGIDINDADEVWSRLTTEEQEEFQKLITNGDIMKLMPDYKPWWNKPKNSKIVVIPSPEEAAKKERSMPEICASIAKFSDICKKVPSPCLHYNLWNILSAYACVARFFGGEQRTNASEAVAHLVNLSATLKYGTNFEDAEDAIISVEMEAITTGNGPAGAAAVGSAGAGSNFLVESREQLQQDARQLMAMRENKLAALSDVLHLLQQTKAMSKRKNPQEAEFQKLFALASGSVELDRTKLSQLARKIEFMLSYVAREEVL
ncbi:zinc finger HIT domain-containing protein 2 [Drosophila kikkawai]|uniref:Zinc finger HIT domain-containing protein 2 n=1 Tax=Drosophila kikkawai TaxID=30033 RepID=A0A6P4I4K4_DROKI|nr:zinc finger HIT domain-containing protein 2 [Drosophila kikkawai]XP_017017556.1 zinc finger HIT domain-containing protein 2 [Drosophila kikkawai]